MSKKEISVDLNELQKKFEEDNTPKSKLQLKLLEKTRFLEKTMENLKAEVEEKGEVVSMCQGKYDIDRENPALKSYYSAFKLYKDAIKQLTDNLPKEQETGDSFDDFD